MIVDLILNRQENDKLISQGYTHFKSITGAILPLKYSAQAFYTDVRRYEADFELEPQISLAMDYGTEADVKNALCQYIIRNEYNLDICKYIHSVDWIE